MKAVRDWVSLQLPNSLLSARTFSGNVSSDRKPDEIDDRGSSITSSTSSVAAVESSNNFNERNVSSSSQSVVLEESHPPSISPNQGSKPLNKIEELKTKFLHFVKQLGNTEGNNPLITMVLYRLHLASLIHSGEAKVKELQSKNLRPRTFPEIQEEARLADLDITLKILVLGKTGVGKSATINSIFGQKEAATDAFYSATNEIREIKGLVKGLKVTIIDTPGLSHSTSYQRKNRNILISVKRFLRKSRPDIVLYFERLDVINMGYNNLPLLKLITDILGREIWFNTILVMTHSSSPLPEGSNGYPVNYESFVNWCTKLVQQYIGRAAPDIQIELPVLLVENHPLCKTNVENEKVLPNGQAWRLQFLLLCVSSKILHDANLILKFHDTFKSKHIPSRLPSLPHLLSSLLKPNVSISGSDIFDGIEELSEFNDEEDYDQLPPIRILTKAQFNKLNKDQKKSYLDELDYRETLYLKKQLKEELKRQRDKFLPKDEISREGENREDDPPQEEIPSLDIELPLSFDSEYPVYRYRCLMNNNDLVIRPVLDSQGWDHDVGFDGINMETSMDIHQRLKASLGGQMSKDKEVFNIQTECSTEYMNPRGTLISSGLEIQNAGKDLVCTIHGHGKFRNLGHNMTGCGLSVTSFGGKCYVGVKVENSILMGKRVKLVCNAGRVSNYYDQMAYGGSLGMTFKGVDYPVRNDKIDVAMTILAFDKERVFGGSVITEFRPFHGTKMSFNANMNSRKMGKISVKTTSSDHFEIALIALVSIVRAIFRKRKVDELIVN